MPGKCVLFVALMQVTSEGTAMTCEPHRGVSPGGGRCPEGDRRAAVGHEPSLSVSEPLGRESQFLSLERRPRPHPTCSVRGPGLAPAALHLPLLLLPSRASVPGRPTGARRGEC